MPEVSELKFDATKKTLIREGVHNEINPFDRRALTYASELKKKYGGEVVVLTMSPPQAKDALIESLAMGADRALSSVNSSVDESESGVSMGTGMRRIQRKRTSLSGKRTSFSDQTRGTMQLYWDMLKEERKSINRQLDDTSSRIAIMGASATMQRSCPY